MRKLVILPIKFYRYAISPMMASHCRFIQVVQLMQLKLLNSMELFAAAG